HAPQSWSAIREMPEWYNSEGIVVGCRSRDDTIVLNLPAPWDVFEAWFKEQGYSVAQGPAGRNVLELVRAVGGLRSAYYLASRDILNLYQHLSKGGSIAYKALVGRIKQFESLGGSRHFGRILQFMTDCRSLMVGLDIGCTECGQVNWFSLQRVADELAC